MHMCVCIYTEACRPMCMEVRKGLDFLELELQVFVHHLTCYLGAGIKTPVLLVTHCKLLTIKLTAL